MRKSINVGVLSVLILTASISFAGGFKKKEFFEGKTASLISVTIDSRIDITQFTQMDILELASRGNELVNNEQFKKDLKEIASAIRDSVYKILDPMYPFSINPEESVIGSEGYKEFFNDKKIKKKKRFAMAPKGYLPLLKRDKKKFVAIFDKIPKSDFIITCEFNLKLHKEKGTTKKNGVATVVSKVTYVVYQREGKKLYPVIEVTGRGGSSEKFTFNVAKTFDVNALKPLCFDAIDAAFAFVESNANQRFVNIIDKWK